MQCATMPRSEKKLSEKAAKAAKPSISKKTGKPCAARYSDGAGLYLHVKPNERKSWVFVWKRNKIKYEKGLGAYPLISLANARKKAQQCREMVADGRNPIHISAEKLKEPTFRECFERYYDDKVEFKILPNGKTTGLKNEKSRQQFRMTMERYAKPLHNIKVSQVEIEDVLGVLRPIWNSKRETASRTQGRIERILSYAIAYGWREGPNPAAWVKNLDNILPPKPTAKSKRNHPALPYADVPAFMTELRQREGVAALVTEFAILTAARSKQARSACFEDIDLKTGLWSVPADKMKGEIVHTVPLCRRSQEIVCLRAQKSGKGLIFLHKRKMLSENAPRALLIRMGYGHITLHGFRASFKTWATSKTNFQREIIEMAMAHKIGDDAEMAYLRETAHDKRRALMQAWSDYCNNVQSGEVVSLHG